MWLWNASASFALLRTHFHSVLLCSMCMLSILMTPPWVDEQTPVCDPIVRILYDSYLYAAIANNPGQLVWPHTKAIVDNVVVVRNTSANDILFVIFIDNIVLPMLWRFIQMHSIMQIRVAFISCCEP